MKKLFLFFIITLTVVTAKAQYLSIGNLKYYITDELWSLPRLSICR